MTNLGGGCATQLAEAPLEFQEETVELYKEKKEKKDKKEKKERKEKKDKREKKDRDRNEENDELVGIPEDAMDGGELESEESDDESSPEKPSPSPIDFDPAKYSIPPPLTSASSRRRTLLQATQGNATWSKSISNIPRREDRRPHQAGFHRTPSSLNIEIPPHLRHAPHSSSTNALLSPKYNTPPGGTSSPGPMNRTAHPRPVARGRSSSGKGKEKKMKKREKGGGQGMGSLKSGWLLKKNSKKKWKKLWFTVEIGMLSYYADSSCSPKGLKGTLRLRKGGCRVVLRGSATETRTFGILWGGMVGKGEKGEKVGGCLEMRAEEIGEVVEWMGALERALLEEVSFGSPFRSLSVISGDGKGFGVSGEGKAAIKKKELGKYEKLVELVTRKENGVLRKVIGECVAKKEEKKLAGEMVHMLEMRGRSMTYLEELIGSSVESCVRPNTLFRGNGMPEKALTAYCYLVGTDYLRRALKPLFLSVLNSNCSYEVDPSKLQPKEDLQANIVNLLSVSQIFIAKIISSKFTNVPYGIRLACRKLAVVTSKKFPDGLYSILGGLFFLRFVCPALTLPTEMGVWDSELTPGAKRALLLITKILMNLSNGVSFGKKEEYMTPMNDFIETHQPIFRSFFDSLIIPPPQQPPPQREEEKGLEEEERERWGEAIPDWEKFASFTRHLKDNEGKIGEKLREAGGEELVNRLNDAVGVALG